MLKQRAVTLEVKMKKMIGTVLMAGLAGLAAVAEDTVCATVKIGTE